jgi:hypothetical protein
MFLYNKAELGGNLTLTYGRIVTGAKELFQSNNAAGSVPTGDIANSYVQGNLRRNINTSGGIYYWPVGLSSGRQLAKLTIATGTTIPSILGFFSPWSSLPAATGLSDNPCNWNYNVNPAFLDNGYWTLTASANPTSATYDMSLFNTAYTNSYGAGSGFTVMKASTIAGPWGLDGVCVGASTAAQTQRTAMSGFSVFASAQTNNPLPIALLNFDAVAQGTGVMTTWVTSTEINNDYFVIERSADGEHFEQVGTRKGAGNSTTTLYYSMLDLNPLKGVSYYRLRQFDFDGAESKSQIVAVSFLSDNVLTAFPNPAQTNNINMRFISAAAGEVKLEFIDMLGKVLVSQMVQVSKGQNEITNYDISTLPQGVYIIQLKPSGSEIIKPMQTRFVKRTIED